ncbi:tetratricopeptide repeat protein [Maribellus sp. CM-23]|uniref:tetratricopeptide repeat-containing sensor histidine kinase n=1 Tax=Maribellus sp. CM-23 TaxID=2781026 RepID=UPI001F1CE30C|nr:tetratricopeptide repeat-containing sensor histidine kinase [Maribellus sp. CM-23]MCE4563965.1 tetratricopeptide repeat protein [Maribellus sp. CM-23]
MTQFDEALQLARLGYNLADQQNDRVNKGDFLRTIGGAYGKKGNIDSASVYYFKALEELEPTQNSEKLGLLYDDMARLYRKLAQPQRALEYYDKALKLYDAENNLEGIARINNESGVVFRDAGDYKTANERFEKSLHIQQARKDSVGIGYALEFLGYNQFLIHDYKKAEDYLTQALKIREQVGEKFAIMLNYTALGELYKQVNQPQKSIEYYEQSNALAKEIDFLDIQTYNYQQIMKNYEMLGNFKRAYQNLKAFNVLNDSLYNAQKLKDVEEITARYETAEKEKQILVQRTKIAEHELSLKSRNLWIFGLSSLVIIIGLIGFLLYKQQMLKNIRQQKDSELRLALEKIDSQNRLQEQRLAISRDLHDNIGAQLSFIVSAIDTIKYFMLDKNDLLTSRLDNIGTFANETIQELRDTIWAMNKPGVSINDLQSKIANFIGKAKQSYHDIEISVVTDEEISAEVQFTSLQGLNIFRIIQEATNNALKYADASHILIQISKQKSTIHFLIKDDGKGFVENEVEPGNGLLNMRKRALELGRELTLISDLGNNTIVSFNVNLKK